MTPDPAIAVRKPADLVDATPYVIGFHPSESLVVLGISGGRVFFGARYDLPPPDGTDILQLGSVIAAQRARCVALLIYGPPAAADPVVARALAVLDAFRVRVLEAIRVHDGRWWSYFCSDDGCCPGDGTPFDTAASVIAAEATFRGQVALPSRQALIAQVATVEGGLRRAMTAATERARASFDDLVSGQDQPTRLIRRAGRLAVREAEKRYRAGRALTDDEVAWLGILLAEPDVNEYALGRVGAEEWRLALWTDVLRRVEHRYVPAAGCVLSYLAWRAGQGGLARVAVDRALSADPQHPMAGLLDEVLGLGIGPHTMSALDPKPRPAATVRRPAPDRHPHGTPRPSAASTPDRPSPADAAGSEEAGSEVAGSEEAGSEVAGAEAAGPAAAEPGFARRTEAEGEAAGGEVAQRQSSLAELGRSDPAGADVVSPEDEVAPPPLTDRSAANGEIVRAERGPIQEKSDGSRRSGSESALNQSDTDESGHGEAGRSGSSPEPARPARRKRRLRPSLRRRSE